MSPILKKKLAHRKFGFKKEFFNFMLHALVLKLETTLEESSYTDDKSKAERAATLWGDFLEQVFQVDRSELLEDTYLRLYPFLKKGIKKSDPSLVKNLYYIEISDLCGIEDLGFDEIYSPDKCKLNEAKIKSPKKD